MDRDTERAASPQAPARQIWGVLAVALGAVALFVVMVQIAAPMLQPHPSAGSQIGEIAGEIKRSAWRSFLGLPRPAAKPAPLPLSAYLGLAVAALGVGAIVLSLISSVMRENWRFAVYGASLGAAAILFQYIWWVTLVIAALVLLVAILQNIGDIFSF